MAARALGLHVSEKRPPAPEGLMVVLVHGSMDRGSGMARVKARLGDLHVVVYDRRGYGRSRGAAPATSLSDHLDDLLAVIDGRPAVVAGHSYGGDLALAAAVRAPGVVRAVMAYEPPMPWLAWWPADGAPGDAVSIAATSAGPEAAAEAFMRGAIGDDRWESLPERTRAERRSEGTALVAELGTLRELPAPFRPEEVAVPTVLASGSRSLPRYRSATSRLARLVPGAELVAIEGAGHGAPATHPDAYAALVRRAQVRSQA